MFRWLILFVCVPLVNCDMYLWLILFVCVPLVNCDMYLWLICCVVFYVIFLGCVSLDNFVVLCSDG